MTTIACNLKEMAGDSKISWEDAGTGVCFGVKIFSANGALYGVRGADTSGQIFAVDWIRDGAIPANRPHPPPGADWMILELSRSGIAIFNTGMEREVLLDSVMAIGTGAKVALYCMKCLGMSPAEAVHEACKVDSFSGGQVYVARLSSPAVTPWRKTRGRKK